MKKGWLSMCVRDGAGGYVWHTVSIITYRQQKKKKKKSECFWLQMTIMNHIMMFKSPWLSLHHPLIIVIIVVIVPLHVLVVYHLIRDATLVVSPALLTSALTGTSSPNLSIFNHSLSNIWGKN